ncbi:MAG: PEP/pyruvate-binding domain-containing protein [Methanobacteriaceae archaeon]|nr:PEP/pyruvate-binding domain-containing protein [Methanobacteriaceae archaeon]
MASNSYVKELQAEDLQLEDIGGKALNLCKISHAGFNVPPAFIVSADAYAEFIINFQDKISKILDSTDFNQEGSVLKGCKEIKSLLKSEPLPEKLYLELTNKISNLPQGYYAVRSSAVAEDLQDASFAGQMDTFLNTRKEDILDRVIDCWASYWNDRAVKYRHDSGMEQLETGLAVLVQKMVNAETSGVTFTANPVNGGDDIVIESTWGLGEAIASGIVTPDVYILNRDGELIEKTIKTKKKGYFLENGRNTLISIEEEKRNKPTLNMDTLKKILKTSMDLERFFNTPQDIEWALEYRDNQDPVIYILQSRPVTTLEGEGDDILWTRAYGDEYWADATTPLFFDVMGKMLTDYVNHEGARIMGYKEITDSKLLKLHKSRVYFNSWVLEKAFSYYPKFARSKELLNYFPLEDQERISQYPSILHKTLLSQILVAIRDPDGMMHRTDKAYRKWAQGFIEKCREFDHIPLATLNDTMLLSLYSDIESAGIKHYQLIRYGMVSHSIATNLMIKNWLLEWLDDHDGSLYAGLISGLDDNKTVEMNIRFSELSKILREDSRLKDKLNVIDDLDVLSDHELDELISTNLSFKEGFEQFIRDYGHRSNTREILYPRWREDKAYVLKVIKLLSSSNSDLQRKEIESREHRLKTEKEVIHKIKKLRFGFFKAKIFSIVLKLAQTYLTFRENQRFYLDHLLYRQRLLIMEMGKRLSERGVIDEVDDVFFLYEDELMELFKGKSGDENIMDKVSRRKREFYRYKSSLPPKFIKNGVEFDDTVMEYDNNSVYGAAASPGIFRGVARVVESVDELSKLEDNEILITSNTDPAWTAVFSKIGGLITETGGILSHGAVISREYRIPAVTAVKGATEIFKTGEKLVVDGNQGVVYKK